MASHPRPTGGKPRVSGRTGYKDHSSIALLGAITLPLGPLGTALAGSSEKAVERDLRGLVSGKDKVEFKHEITKGSLMPEATSHLHDFKFERFETGTEVVRMNGSAGRVTRRRSATY